MASEELIHCTACGHSAAKSTFVKSCGNCFACTGCEVYICPGCANEIIIKPIDSTRSFRKLRR